MNAILNSRWAYAILAFIVIATRVPFLFDGFGHEEDSWGLAVNSWEMHKYGHYVASRFPGHPLQEYLYAAIWNKPAWVYNSLSTFFSVIAVLSFYRSLKKLETGYAFEGALMLTFVPVFYAAGTYTIDFAWTLAFVLASLALLLDRKFILAGILIGLGIGCRITTGIFLLPWIILIWNRFQTKEWMIQCMKLCLPAVLIGVAFYIPAYSVYGSSFFDYSDQFPYPPLAKIIYKATIGVFGLLGIIAIAIPFIRILFKRSASVINPSVLFSPKRLLSVLALIIALHIISYLRLPQKSGYMLPIVPFVIMLVILFSDKKFLRITTILVVLSPFLLSINLTDSFRGADHSALAMTFHASGQEIFIDPFSGPILSEQAKRRNKMEYCEAVKQTINNSQGKDVIICGWWYNELLTDYLPGMPDYHGPCKSELHFYRECKELQELKSLGYKIYYLPEQNLYNDQMFGQNCTDSLAKPFEVR
jgi:hypothetical protein